MDRIVGSLEFNPEEAIQGYILREKLASFHIPNSANDQFLAGIHHEETQNLLVFQEKDKIKWFILALRLYKDSELQSTPFLACKAISLTLVNAVATPLLRQALDYYQKGKFATFISYYDYTEGIFEIAMAILQAINELQGKGPLTRDKTTIRYLQHRKVLPSQAIDLMERLNQQEAEYFQAILERDPTGRSAVEEMLRQLEDEAKWKEAGKDNFLYPKILDYQYPKLYVAGAKFGFLIYQELWELWDKDQQLGDLMFSREV